MYGAVFWPMPILSNMYLALRLNCIFATKSPSTIDILFYFFISPPVTTEYFVRIYQDVSHDANQ